MGTIRFAVIGVIAAAGCAAATPASSTQPSSGGYESAPAYQEAAAPALPGTYQQGIGNPFIHVVNNLGFDLSLSVTDGAGYAYNAYVPAGQSYDLQISPGTFSYTASADGETASGVYAVEYDNGYTWTWEMQSEY
jgi:hypothetical protein